MKLPSTIYRLIVRYHGHGDASFDPVETFEALAEQAMEYIGHDEHLLNREYRAFVDQFDVETNAHESTREVTDAPIIADLDLDLTDLWNEVTDPECERGDDTAWLFDVSSEADSEPVARGHGEFGWRDCRTYTATFKGIRVENRDFRKFVSREYAITVFGMDRISEIEDWASQQAQDEAA